jgi:hypothetical protein
MSSEVTLRHGWQDVWNAELRTREHYDDANSSFPASRKACKRLVAFPPRVLLISTEGTRPLHSIFRSVFLPYPEGDLPSHASCAIIGYHNQVHQLLILRSRQDKRIDARLSSTCLRVSQMLTIRLKSFHNAYIKTRSARTMDRIKDLTDFFLDSWKRLVGMTEDEVLRCPNLRRIDLWSNFTARNQVSTYRCAVLFRGVEYLRMRWFGPDRWGWWSRRTWRDHLVRPRPLAPIRRILQRITVCRRSTDRAPLLNGKEIRVCNVEIGSEDSRGVRSASK